MMDPCHLHLSKLRECINSKNEPQSKLWTLMDYEIVMQILLFNK